MAEAAVSFAVEKLGNLLVHKVGFLLGVEGQLKNLKDELQWMRSFLKDASERQAKDERIRKWISDTRDLAQDVEDAIDSFALKVDAPRKGKNRGTILAYWCLRYPQKANHIFSLEQDINSIQTRLKDIGDRRGRYVIESLDDDSGRRNIDGDVERRRRVLWWKEDKHVVGLETDAETLIQKAILADKAGLSVASIVGMGGAGKSTLAKKVYHHPRVVAKFECRAWVTLSSDFSSKDVMKKMVEEILKPEAKESSEETLMQMVHQRPMEAKEWSEETLMQMVHQKLKGKQYLVVVDDVWRRQDWDWLAPAFPDNQAKKCRLLITSRSHNIPRDTQYVHHLHGLDSNKSWELFLKVALNCNNEVKCPPELESIGKEIVKKCNGLPLAIVVIGGLLLEQGEIRSRWEKVGRGVTSYLRGSTDSVSKILELSYHDLPPHLKACFLCLSLFREDDVIQASRLISVWIAEGFFSDGEGERTMEEIGMSYLDELITRNMILVDETSPDGQVGSCRMHDLLRDLSITKAREEINFHIVREGNASRPLNEARHIAVYCSNESLMLFKSPSPHVRSLFFHESGHSGDGVPSSNDFWRSFVGLRVLYLESMGLTVISKMIGRLLGLRFLSLRDNKIHQLPKSLRHLKNLQTLDISANEKVNVPNILWELDSLRHLYMPFNVICQVPLKLDTLKNLQTIDGILIKNVVVEHLKELVNLRTLKVELVIDTDVNEFFTSLSMLRNLAELFLQWNNGYVSLDGMQDLKHITLLKITGPLQELPKKLPPNISVLALAETELDQDPMLELERLQNLSHLSMCSNSYKGKEMVIGKNGFPSLRVLRLQSLLVQRVRIESGALSKLKQMLVSDCSNLEILPQWEEMRIMSNLQKFVIRDPSERTSIKLKEYSNIISSIPYVEISGANW